MNIKKLREKIAENFGVKITCLVIAVLIFFFHELSTLETKIVAVPLDVISMGKTEVFSGLEESDHVRITLRGRKDEIASISENDLHAFIDISAQDHAGTFVFPVFVKKDIRIEKLETLEITVKPEKLELYLDEVASKYVEVKPDVTGLPLHGYEQVGTEVSPRKVLVTGPSKLVNELDSLNVLKLDITDAKNDVVKKLSVVKPVNKIRLDNSVVEVTAKIRPRGLTKAFTQVQVEFKNIDEALELQNPYAALDVTVEGEILTLEKLSQSSIVLTADCEGLEEAGQYVLEVSAALPKGVRLVSISSDTINIELQEKLPPSEKVEDVLIEDEIEAEL